MAAVKKVTREKIISAALKIVSKRGMWALNARDLSAELGCSTRPIYLTFGGMDGVKEATKREVERIFQGYLQREVESGKYPVYKSYGMGYIRFAREEKELFALLFMSRQEKKTDESFMDGVYSAIERATGLDSERAKLFHFENWIFVHGIATMAATDYADFNEDLVQGLLTDVFEGLKARFGVGAGGNK